MASHSSRDTTAASVRFASAPGGVVADESLLAGARALEPVMRQYADTMERERRLSRPVLDALRQAGLLRMFTPRTLGGFEADPLTVARVVELVSQTAGHLWTAVAPLTQATPETRVWYAAREADVRAVARVVEKRSDGYALLVRLRHELEQCGWVVLRPPSPESGLERLDAEREGSHLVASYADESGAVLFELSSMPLPVGVERARELVH